MSDYIDRQAVIEIIQSMYPGMPRVPWMLKKWQEQYEPYIRLETEIKALPSAQLTEASCWGCNCQKMERLKEQKTFSEMVHLHDAETHGNAQF